MPDPTITRAALADLDALTPLFDAYRLFYKQPSDVAAARAYLTERLQRDEAVVFLARDAARPVGFTLLYPGFSSVTLAPRWVLSDLYVDPSARRTGLGRSLMLRAADHCRANSIPAMWLATAEDNTPAQSLYESLGWEWNRQYRRYIWKA